MRLVFMGTPDFSVPALDAIIAAGHDVIAVYTRAPKPAGRGQKEQKSPVHIVAEKHNIPVLTPTSLKGQKEQAEFAALKSDMAIVSAYGLLLPDGVLNTCPCINIHASLLPHWRGAAPIQRAILAGDDLSGITIMQMDKGLDTGDMLLWEEVAITPKTNAGELHDNLSSLGARLITRYLTSPTKFTPIKQDNSKATYANKLTKEEAGINWHKTSAEIDRHIRAFNPFPGAYFSYNGNKIKIFRAEFLEQKNGNEQPGNVVGDNLEIACKNGVIQPLIVQREGKKIMPVSELLRGFPIPKGATV